MSATRCLLLLKRVLTRFASLFSFDAAPGANAPGAQSGLDALSSLPAIPTQNPSVFSPPSQSAQTVNGSGGGDLLDLL